MLSAITVVGTLVSDVLLAIIDPRIRARMSFREASPTAEAPAPTGAATLAPRRHAEDRVATAGQWRLIWWRFRRHKLAMTGLVVTILIYLVGDLRGLRRPHRARHHENTRHTLRPAPGESTCS